MLSISVAVLSMVVFAYALANVTMRLQRHITARQQWSRDSRTLGRTYEGLVRAAAANDGFAYDVLRPLAWNGTLSLQQDAAAMPSREQPQHLALLRRLQNCVPQTLPAFKAQAPDVADDCQRLLAAPASSEQ